MTGSAINIAAGQVPSLFGIQKLFNTRAATYLVIINTHKNLNYTTLDAAFGVTALVALYVIKWSLAWSGKRYPRFSRAAFFLTAFRHAFILIIFTIAAWRTVIQLKPKNYPITVLGPVPRGLKHVGQPYITTALLSALGPKIPVLTIILFLEHISIAKLFDQPRC